MNRPTGSQFEETAEGAVATTLDADAFVVAAWEAHRAVLHSFLRRSTRDEAAAEDLVQDAFIRLTREVRAGRAPDEVRAWLFRVAANLAVSRGRRLSTALRWLDRARRSDDPLTAESPERSAIRRERHDDIERALAGLHTDARTALLLAGQGYRGDEIAAAIGRSPGATRTLLCRARLQVRQTVPAGEADR